MFLKSPIILRQLNLVIHLCALLLSNDSHAPSRGAFFIWRLSRGNVDRDYVWSVFVFPCR
jgi:hypothetical protein